VLSAAEITSMRATQEEALPDTCVISRATLTADGAGGQTETWATVATVACRVAAMGGRGAERLIADRLSAVTPYVVTLPAETDVEPEDRIVIGTRTLEVAAVLAIEGWETARRVAAVETR